MSKLIDKLKLASQTSPQPMGFGPGKSSPAKPAMVLIASLAQTNVENLTDYVSGADAGLWHISSGSAIKALHKAAKTMTDLPWGWWLGGGSEGEVEKILKLGDDFVVFPIDTPLAIPQDDKVGRILQVEASLNEGALRTINNLPVNAVLLTSGQDSRLTWYDLMFFRRVASVLTKPLLATIPPNVTSSELQSLWEAGVDGMVVEVDVGKPAGKINELHQIINRLAYPKSRKRGKVEPLLPHVRSDIEIVSEDEEEE